MNRPSTGARSVRRLLAVAVLFALLPTIGWAHSNYNGTPISPQFTGQYVAAAATPTTTNPTYVGDSVNHGIDWVVTTAGSVNVKVEILQSNAKAGPYAKWANPTVSGSAAVSTIVITSANGGTDLILSPCAWVKFKLTNQDASSAVVTMRSFHQ